jgi:hypothetical protein
MKLFLGPPEVTKFGNEKLEEPRHNEKGENHGDLYAWLKSWLKWW